MAAAILKRALSLVMSAGFAVGLAAPGFAEQFSPVGIWEPSNKESKYEFTYCGEDNQRLCAKLIWIREDVQDSRNMKYLDTYMFTDARHVRQNQWRGTVTLEGFRIGGTVTQTSPDRMDLKACAVFVFCEDIRLRRVE